MTSDTLLNSIALVELVQKLGGTVELDDYTTLLGGVCDHHRVALYLAGAICAIAAETDFALQDLLDHERAEALGAHQEPPGLA